MKPREAIHNGKRVQVVQWTENGKRRKKFFSSKAAARIWIAERQAAEENLGREIAAAADQKFIFEAVALSERLEKKGATLKDAVEHYLQHLELIGNGRPMGQLLNEFLAAKQKQVGGRQAKDLRLRLEKMKDYFGADTVPATLSTLQVERWLDSLSVGNQSFNHYRANAHTFFSWLTKRRYCDANPVAAIEKRAVKRSLPGIFKPQQIAIMLNKAPNQHVTAFVALGAFAGLRSSEIGAMDWEHIHVKQGTIDLTHIAKGARRRFVEIRPFLRSILQPIALIAGPVIPDGFDSSEVFQKFKKDLGFDWVDNGLRHSFATYHLAAFQDPGKTSLQMGHGGSPTMLFQRYNRPGITQAEALRFWQEDPGEVAKEVAR